MTEHTHRQQGGGRSHWHAAIIFDADGTLIDSEVPGLDVIHQVALEHGIRISRLDAHDRFRGVHMTDVVSWFARALPPQWAAHVTPIPNLQALEALLHPEMKFQ